MTWQDVITRLRYWERDPAQLEDVGVTAPTAEIIGLAIRTAEYCDANSFESVGRVVPDPNGGIVFQLREGLNAEAVHVWSDGNVEYQRFQEARLVERSPLVIADAVTPLPEYKAAKDETGWYVETPDGVTLRFNFQDQGQAARDWAQAMTIGLRENEARRKHEVEGKDGS